jgi:hypothetical protein
MTADEMYALLPAVHRVRDAELGSPLKAFVGVLAQQSEAMAFDIDGLYANWFIETCQDWVVPYIGDLLRVRRIDLAAAGKSERGYVADTLAYRRRKGTVSVVERLAVDVTGWRAKAVETFKVLGTTQNVNHLRPQNVRTPDLRKTSDLELLGGPFESAAHSVEVRRIEPRRGRYNIPDVAVMLWRLQAYPVVAATARPVTKPSDGRYTFNPLGLDEPLFNPPATETAIDHLATEVDVPGALRPRAVHDDLLLDPTVRQYLGETREVFGIGRIDAPGGTPSPFKTQDISICDLRDWQRPGAGRVAVDVSRGRLAFPAGDIPLTAGVSYAYGFSADTGAGPYDRSASVESWRKADPAWLVGVIHDLTARQGAPDPSVVFATLRDAITAWNAQPPGEFGVICVMDSTTFPDPLPPIVISGGSKLAIVAATCGALLDPTGSSAIETDELMPVVAADLAVSGTTPAGTEAAGTLIIDGLFVIGGVTVDQGSLGRLEVRCTTVTGGISVPGTGPDGQRNEGLEVVVADSLCGPVAVPGEIDSATFTDSVIDGAGSAALAMAGSQVGLDRCTVLGTTAAKELSASDCIFTASLDVARLQEGCVRFSYVPDGSAVPKAFRCQPALAVKAAAPAEASTVRARLVPAFTSTTLGDPGYAQLAEFAAPELLAGASNESEMGAFNKLRRPQREANLRAALDEYLRFGLEAGVFYVN